MIQVAAFHSIANPDPHRLAIVRTPGQLQELDNALAQAPTVCFDFETSGTAWWAHARACGVSFGVGDRGGSRAWYVPFKHHNGESQWDEAVVAPLIARTLGDASKRKLAHNLKFDWHIARAHGWEVRGPIYDTMVAARLFDENRPVGLKQRAKEDLGRPEGAYWDEKVQRELALLARRAGKGKQEYLNRWGYSQVGTELLGIYAGLDACNTFDLWTHYERWGVSRSFPRVWDTEMELLGVLMRMEERGLPLDVEYLTNLRLALEAAQAGLEDRIRAQLGARTFNFGSDVELRWFLSKALRLPLWKKTKGGEWAVDREVLDYFSDRVPVLDLIAEWRDAEKLRNTYTESMLGRLDAQRLLHCDFKQAGTNTGRLASADPNLQNIAGDRKKRAAAHGGVDPWSIKRAFTMRAPGWMRLYLDYSQVELRVLAFYTGDPVLRETYRTGGDAHTAAEQEVFGTKGDEENRRRAKAVNFGLSYGLSDVGLARQIKSDVPTAESIMARFNKRFARIPAFRQEFWAWTRSQGCVFQNVFGRPRRLPELLSREGWERGRAERQAIGTLIQGTAAELMKEGLVRLEKRMQREGLAGFLVNTVHDEAQIDLPVGELARTLHCAAEELERYPELSPVPIVTDAAWTATNWAEKQKMPKWRTA